MKSTQISFIKQKRKRLLQGLEEIKQNPNEFVKKKRIPVERLIKKEGKITTLSENQINTKLMSKIRKNGG